MVTNKNIITIPANEELARAMLRYAISVVYSRAIPSIDGLKPVQRRILYGMYTEGWTADKPFVKVSRIAGHIMGVLHPHGDSSISDALVKLQQPFYSRVPLIDGYGNFGDITGSAAGAARYIEARLAKAAEFILREVKEDTVPTVPNYDHSSEEILLAPIMFPLLTVQGAWGVGVGFATKIPPANLHEVIEGTKALIRKPNLSLDQLMKYIPGPDFPTGAELIGLDGIKEAYETGRGLFKIRAKAHINPLPRGKHEIVFTELPYGVATERIISRVKELLKEGKLAGLADAKDLTDKNNGLRVVIETKAGASPDVLLAELYKETPLEESFGVNSVVIVDGNPKTIGLLEMLQLFIDFRRLAIKRRSNYRKTKREERLHLVEGLLKSLANIDEVIKIVRAATDATVAQQGLMNKFKLDEIQADYVLAIPLRRLTKYDSIQLQDEQKRLNEEIAALNEILSNPKALEDTMIKELDEVKKAIPSERKSTILGVTLSEHLEASKEAVAQIAGNPDAASITDEQCFISITHKGGIIRTATPQKKTLQELITSTRTPLIGVTTHGRGFKLDAYHVGEKETALKDLFPEPLRSDERILTFLQANDPETVGVALGTSAGVVKITAPQWPTRSDVFDIINLSKDDRVVGARRVTDPANTALVFISTDSSLLTYTADKVRPQGLSGAGMAGIKLASGAEVLSFDVILPEELDTAQVLTIADSAKGKLTPLKEYPPKGRATGGVRSQAFLKGETQLIHSQVASSPVAIIGKKILTTLPPVGKRDGSGKEF